MYLYFFMVETKGKNGPLSLEEIAALFDGETSQVSEAGEKAAGETPGTPGMSEKYEDGKAGTTEFIERA